MRRWTRTVLRTLAAGAVLGAAAAGATVALGLYNVSAQRGHWPGVGWILHTTFRNSVSLRAPDEDVIPDLSDRDLVALGAGHYATACAPCHAAPGTARPATVRGMAPAPPHIGEAIKDWKPNHLHWIAENGAKMTGMPAWPATGREDEVWAVVAYLEAIRQSAAPDLPAPDRDDGAPADVAYCRTCHGRIAGGVPRLDIQEPDYLQAALEAYASGHRASGIMAQAASLVSPERFADIARHLAGAPAGDTPSAAPPADPAGEDLARRGTRDVPACIACHGPASAAGPEDRRRFPALAGQHRAFLATELRLWRDGVRTGSPLMTAAARNLSDREIDLLSTWYAAQQPEPAGGN